MDEGRYLAVEDRQLLRLDHLGILKLGREVYAVEGGLVGFTRVESVYLILNTNDLQRQVRFNIDLPLIYVHPSLLHITHYLDLIPRHPRGCFCLHHYLSLIQP